MKSKKGDLESMVNEAKILTIDIETSPIVAYTWGPKWETDILKFIDYSKIVCFSAKWYKGEQITKALPDYAGYKPGKIDDYKIVKDIYKLLDEADIVVGQNSIAFDIKTINARFLAHELTPPSPYKQIDTKLEAKKYLFLPSNKLDDLGDYFNIGHKIEHEGMNLWFKCLKGDMKAWNKMKRYNKQDVLLTERVYEKIRPFMKAHPNVTLYSEKPGCPKCGSTNIYNRGYYVLTSGKYHKASCNDCGGWFRYGKAIPLDNKKTKGTNI